MIQHSGNSCPRKTLDRWRYKVTDPVTNRIIIYSQITYVITRGNNLSLLTEITTSKFSPTLFLKFRDRHSPPDRIILTNKTGCQNFQMKFFFRIFDTSHSRVRKVRSLLSETYPHSDRRRGISNCTVETDAKGSPKGVDYPVFPG